MKTKFINSTETITPEVLEGYTMAFKDRVVLGGENIILRKNPKSQDKVAIVAFGGSGHEPAVSGYVGEGMLDVSVVGDIFAAPGAQRLLQGIELVNRPAGVLLLILNHAGDMMSGNMARQLAERKGIKIKSIYTHDDISAGLDAADEDRRGLAGAIVLYKVLGAAAEAGCSLDQLVEIGERLNPNIATLAVATRSCTHPQNGATITAIEEGKMQIGMGQHGEAGQGGDEPIISADDTAEKMIGLLMKKLQIKSGEKVLLFINGVGSSTLMEQLLVYRAAAKILEAAGAEIIDGYAGEMLTVQEQGGFQMILARLDEEQANYYKNYPANAPYWTRK